MRRLALFALVSLGFACGRPAAQLERARDLALEGHHRTALLEARAVLLAVRDQGGEKADAVRRGALKLAGDLCAVYLADARCAAHEYRELVQHYPTSAEAFEARERLGDLDFRAGDVRGAIVAWRDQVAAAPDRKGADQAELKIARALLDHGDYDGARAAVAELQSRWPHSTLAPAAALLAASTFHLEGHHAQAVSAYEEVERKFHGTAQGAEALFEKGNCLAELGDDERAVRAYTDALVRHDSPEAVEFALQRAQRRLDRGKAVNPHNWAAVWDRGLARHTPHHRASATQ
jgi:TolA-binding protein